MTTTLFFFGSCYKWGRQYYCAIMLHSLILLPPVGHSANYEYHFCQLTRQPNSVSNFYGTFKVLFLFPSYAHSLTSSSLTYTEWYTVITNTWCNQIAHRLNLVLLNNNNCDLSNVGPFQAVLLKLYIVKPVTTPPFKVIHKVHSFKFGHCIL